MTYYEGRLLRFCRPPIVALSDLKEASVSARQALIGFSSLIDPNPGLWT
jgi:hypothetical protein